MSAEIVHLVTPEQTDAKSLGMQILDYLQDEDIDPSEAYCGLLAAVGAMVANLAYLSDTVTLADLLKDATNEIQNYAAMFTQEELSDDD